MDDITDTYRTIIHAAEEIMFKEKGSKFFGYAFPIGSESDVKPIIETIKRKHSKANHVCYAWQLGVENVKHRTNDDGEPNNSAGVPIYGQIQSYEVTNILIAVARIFGGTKLGMGGLIKAYRATAQETLDSCRIVEKALRHDMTLSFQYSKMDTVMRTVKQKQLKIISQTLESECEIIVSVRKRQLLQIEDIFKGIPGVKIR